VHGALVVVVTIARKWGGFWPRKGTNALPPLRDCDKSIKAVARPPIPAGVVRVAVEGHSGTAPWVNTFWLATTGASPPTGTQVSGLASSFMGLFNTMWSADTSSTAGTSQTICEWNDGAGNVVDGAASTPVAGTSGSGYLPASVAMVISWRLAQRYRGGHPRTYIAGCSIGMLATQTTFSTSVVSDMQTHVNTFLAAVNGLAPSGFSSVTLGVLRQFANGGSETKPPTFLNPPQFKPFVSGIVKPGVATQRRRLGDNLN
jgi:hypothetical protein